MAEFELKISIEGLVGLMQGKKYFCTDMENTFTIHPPFEGVYITHRELAELRNNDTMGVLNFVESLQKVKE